MRTTKTAPEGSANAFLTKVAAERPAPVAAQGGLLKYDPGQRYEEMTTVLVPIALVVQNKFQPRLWMNPDKVRELADSIKATGQLQAASGKQLDDGRVMLIAGGTRAEAVKLLHQSAAEDEKARYAFLRVELKVGVPDTELLRQALAENMVREDLNPMDEAASLAQYRDMLELKKAVDVAAEVGLEERRARVLLALHDDCPPVVHAAVRGQDLASFMRTEAELAGDPTAEKGVFALPPSEPRKAERALSRDAAIEFGKLYRHFKKVEPTRATLQTAKYIQRAIVEAWSVARTKERVKQVVAESKGAATRAKPAVFRNDGSAFNVNLRLLADAPDELIAELRAEFERLIQNRKLLAARGRIESAASGEGTGDTGLASSGGE